MKNKKELIKRSLLIMVLPLMALFLSSCAKSAYSKELDQTTVTPEVIIIEETEQAPEVIEPETEEPEISFLTHEGARDIAVAYLVEKFGLPSPSTWESIDQTPENLVGASAFAYTSGAWVAFVEAPVVAPQYLVYSIEVDNVAHGLRWTGEVNAEGEIKENSISGPMQVLSSLEARDLAAEFIQSNYDWDAPGEWRAEQMQPIENAGIQQTFTAGSWVIQIKYLAAAPIVPEYHITADHLTLITRWTGTIKASGEILEGSYLTD